MRRREVCLSLRSEENRGIITGNREVAMNRPRSLRDSDLHRLIAAVMSLSAAATLSAQAPGLQMNVMYQCPALQAALKVYSCTGPAAGDTCDVETFSPGQPGARGKSPRQQVMTVLAVCHVQTAAEA